LFQAVSWISGNFSGAYAGSSYVNGSGVSYNGWGITPHVSSKVFNQEGTLKFH